MARDPKVFGFFISDEPDPNACPAAPAQHRCTHAAYPRPQSGQAHGPAHRLELGASEPRADPEVGRRGRLSRARSVSVLPGQAVQFRVDRQGHQGRRQGGIVVLGSRAGVRRLDLALADDGRGAPHALAVGGVEAVRLHDLQLAMERPHAHGAAGLCSLSSSTSTDPHPRANHETPAQAALDRHGQRSCTTPTPAPPR